MNDSRALDILLAALRDKKWVIRKQAAECLAFKKDPRVVESLIDLLAEESGINRKVLMTPGELKEIGVSAVGPRRVEVLDESGLVREKVVWALSRITDQHFGEDAAKWQEWWEKNKERVVVRCHPRKCHPIREGWFARQAGFNLQGVPK